MDSNRYFVNHIEEGNYNLSGQYHLKLEAGIQDAKAQSYNNSSDVFVLRCESLWNTDAGSAVTLIGMAYMGKFLVPTMW